MKKILIYVLQITRWYINKMYHLYLKLNITPNNSTKRKTAKSVILIFGICKLRINTIKLSNLFKSSRGRMKQEH